MRASEKLLLAFANVSDPLFLVVTGIDSEVGTATDGPSPLRSVALWAMRGYLVVAVVLLIVKSLQLATGHA